ncbi:hypothetical protein MKX03_030197 [Papaver bracteatum]|nr:hypothetical protein MKX03_030197 [Papaver bracteatum]
MIVLMCYPIGSMRYIMRFCKLIQLYTIFSNDSVSVCLPRAMELCLYSATLALCPMEFGDPMRRKPCPFVIFFHKKNVD